MADLKVDTDELREASVTLSKIRLDLEDASGEVETTASAVGDDTLANAVRKFATSWNQHRGELVEQVDKLAGHLNNAAENIDAVDQALADSI